jgi:hypothetical protein
LRPAAVHHGPHARPATNAAKPGDFNSRCTRVDRRSFPDASSEDERRAKVDTLYSSAKLNLSAGPTVLSVTDAQGRDCLVPLKKNRDRPLELYLQHDSPSKDKEPNWLPVGARAFTMSLRRC